MSELHLRVGGSYCSREGLIIEFQDDDGTGLFQFYGTDDAYYDEGGRYEGEHYDHPRDLVEDLISHGMTLPAGIVMLEPAFPPSAPPVLAVEEKCLTCRFSRPGTNPNAGLTQTECRSHSPLATISPRDPAPHAVWPLVDFNDWCGDYDAIDTVKAA